MREEKKEGTKKERNSGLYRVSETAQQKIWRIKIMFKELMEEWNTSSKTREDKFRYTKGMHTALMRASELKSLIEASIIDKIEITGSEMDIILNEDHYNIKMRINANDYEEGPVLITALGNYEAEETDMVCKILDYFRTEKDFVVFDIGANVGWYTMNILKRFTDWKVYSFEPSPITYERLVHNLQLNDLNSENAVNVGFYKENGKLDFYYDKETSGASSLVDLRERSSVSKISVDMKKMDDYVTEHHINRVDFIKCDVEGAELFVYEGGREIITKNRPIIFSEMLRKWAAKFGYTPNDIIGFMKKLGYGCYVITQGEKLRECPLVDEDTVETNYFFLHREKHEKVINALVDER